MKKMKTTIQENSIICFLIITLLGCSTSTKIVDFDNIKLIDNTVVISESKNYLKDSIEFGFMGLNDNIQIIINKQLIFDSKTNYDARIGYGEKLLNFERPRNVNDLICEVIFFKAKKRITYKLNNNFNSILIHNNLHYNSLDLQEFEENVIIYLYNESDRFY